MSFNCLMDRLSDFGLRDKAEMEGDKPFHLVVAADMDDESVCRQVLPRCIKIMEYGEVPVVPQLMFRWLQPYLGEDAREVIRAMSLALVTVCDKYSVCGNSLDDSVIRQIELAGYWDQILKGWWPDQKEEVENE